MKIIVINLDHSKDRLEHMKKELKKFNMTFERFSAVHGKTLSSEEIRSNTSFMCQNLFCSPGMVGCALSHMQILKNFVENNEEDENEFLCVMEDDICLHDMFPTVLKKVPHFYTALNFDVISLKCMGLCSVGKKINVDEFAFVQSLFPLSTTCYIVSKKGAQHVLNILGTKVQYHIDFTLALSKLKTNLKYYVLISPQVVSLNETNSTMGIQCKSIILSTLKCLKLDSVHWFLNVPVFSVKMRYTISLYVLLLLIILAVATFKKITFLMIATTLELFLIFLTTKKL